MSSQIIKGILSSTRYATISTVDSDGRAWAAPVWFVANDIGTLYWWSSVHSQHSQNIERDSDVYITIFDSRAAEGDGLGLYIRAVAQPVPESKLEQTITLYNSTTSKFKLSRENTTGVAPTRLYQAEPLTMQVNDGTENNGFWEDVRRDAV